MKLRSLPLALLSLVCLATLAATPLRAEDPKPARWTVLVYIAADNNLEPNSVINLLEMAAIGSTPDVNIVAQITRSPEYAGFYGEWGGTRRFLVTKGTSRASRRRMLGRSRWSKWSWEMSTASSGGSASMAMGTG